MTGQADAEPWLSIPPDLRPRLQEITAAAAGLDWRETRRALRTVHVTLSRGPAGVDVILGDFTAVHHVGLFRAHPYDLFLRRREGRLLREVQELLLLRGATRCPREPKEDLRSLVAQYGGTKELSRTFKARMRAEERKRADNTSPFARHPVYGLVLFWVAVQLLLVGLRYPLEVSKGGTVWTALRVSFPWKLYAFFGALLAIFIIKSSRELRQFMAESEAIHRETEEAIRACRVARSLAGGRSRCKGSAGPPQPDDVSCKFCVDIERESQA